MSRIYRGRSNTEFYLAAVLYDSIEDLNKSGVHSLIVEKGANANIVLPRQGIAPFHQIIASENPRFAMETTVLILQHGGNPNVRSDEGLTPLHIAAAWGRRDLVELLLRCGADPDLQDNSYMTAGDYAKEEEYQDIVGLIRDFIDAGVKALFDSRNLSAHKHFVFALDKVLVSNGQAVGEYEVISELRPQDAIDLQILPQANPNEYVRNWCNSLDDQLAAEAEDALPDYRHVTMFRPVANCRQSSSVCSSSEQHHDSNADCSKFSFRSRESGIHTLPGSMLEEYDRSKATPARRISKDTSSDYFTCTEVSEPLDERDSGAALNMAFLDQEMSFVSVSEVYKYVDAEEGVCLYEKRLVPACGPPNLNDTEVQTISSKSSKVSSLPVSFDYDTDSLRRELAKIGYAAGPITKSTKRVYLRKLHQHHKHPQVAAVTTEGVPAKIYSKELQKTLRNSGWSSDLTPYRVLEEEVIKQFSNPDPSRKWREGINKASFTYLLLDPRVTKNLPSRAESLSESDLWTTFLQAIFYVGKGKRSRPYHHLYDAIALHNKGLAHASNRKLQRILDIWGDGQGVVCLHIFQNIIPVEAYTREAAMIAALKLSNVENIRFGDFYGIAATWTSNQQQQLGVYLLHKALRILMQEGERQLSPNDID